MAARNIYYKDKPIIWPTPNECRWGEGFLELGTEWSLSCDDVYKEEAELFLSALNKKEDINVDRVSRANPVIKVCRTDSGEMGDEGYVLEVAPSGITLGAATKKGAFYGLQTLTQLIENSRDGKIPAVFIKDSPFKEVRGLHFYVPPRKDLGWFRRFLDFIAKYKYNTIYMEIGAAMRFDSHPEINEAWEKFCKEMLVYPGGPDGNTWGNDGMQMRTGHLKNSVHIENGGGSFLEKWELAELVEYAAKRHIEIIPEVQSYAHSYWMLLAHPECAERADDMYPDTYCPSNPRTYEIYFDCLQEVLDVFKPAKIHIGHDELQWVGTCEHCREKTGHDLLAGDITKLYNWLKERGIKTLVWGDKFLHSVKMDPQEIGMPVGGNEHMPFNQNTRRNEIFYSTWRATDMIPGDITIVDWHYNVGGRDSGSQNYFCQHGMDVIYGNFNPDRFINVEDRLRWPNVKGGETSLWHETSDLGMAMTNGVVRYLDTANVLWYEGYKKKIRHECNNAIALIYPGERDKLNGLEPIMSESSVCHYIDISGQYNVPLNWIEDYRFISKTEQIPGAVPFELGIGVKNTETDPACILIGHGREETVEHIEISGRYSCIAFLHSYTENLGMPPLHPCSYVGPEQDIVGYYTIVYEDGSSTRIPIEYSRNIISLGHEFGAHWANPAYQNRTVRERVVKGKTSKKISYDISNRVVFSYEWRNPNPEKAVKGVRIEHDAAKEGGIVLFGITCVE